MCLNLKKNKLSNNPLIMKMIEILNKDIFEISKLIQNKTITPVDIYNNFQIKYINMKSNIKFVEIYSDWEEKARIAENKF